MTRILLLGGTQEARALAAELTAAGLDVLVSLAGRASAAAYPGETRTGGFGGEHALADFLRRGRFALLIDATHPFAATISPAAARAAYAAGLPYLRLERPPWHPEAGDVEVPTLKAAAAALKPGSRTFLTVGSGSLAPFLERRDVAFVVRTVEAPDLMGRADIKVLRARGPFALADERALWDTHRFDTLVTKNAGGAATEAKLLVARERETAIVFVARPDGQPPADAVDVAGMMALVRRSL